MAERCAFVNNCEIPCPMGVDIVEVSGGCEPDAQGEKCGPVAAYGMLTHEYGRLEGLDAVAPIVGTFTITEIPEGMPPLAIRKHWLGVSLPVRYPRSLACEEVEVSPADAVISLLDHGKLEAADWFQDAGLALGALSPTWIFQAGEGTVTHTEPIISADFYGASLSAEARNTIQQA